jgi:hypothetical protein
MNPFWSLAVIALLFANPIHARSVYKCVQPNKSVIFTDGKCPKNSQETLIDKETSEEIQHREQEEKVRLIKQLIANQEPDKAKQFALKNNLVETYEAQLALFLNQKKVDAEQQATEQKEAAERQQQQLLIQQQQMLVLQKQQLLAIEKAQAQAQQQQINNTPYYYGYGYSPLHHSDNTSCQMGVCAPSTPSNRNYAPLSSGGMNPPSSSVVERSSRQAPVPAINSKQFLPAQNTAPKK